MYQMFLENKTEEAFIEELRCNVRDCNETRHTYALNSFVQHVVNRLSRFWLNTDKPD
ncbi:hypothetical protein VSU01S_02660 [Vibrio superstes NBRC 103154]|uniref:Uncharacterized protein n=1 Tax=Vibrio superstes NBRC 103154 TaxID=1219062 RepID=A0A511QL62_9VIBR|nr:hypothetical protein VSU01S_02660 [Vibrio superstes NBRC 103154]